MTVTSLPFSSSTLRSSASAYLRPSWKMWPISTPRASSSGPEPSGAGSPAQHLGGLDDAVPGEVAAGDEVEHVLAGLVGAGDPAGAGDDAGVDQVADLRLALRAEHLRPDVALDQRGVAGEVGERLDLGRARPAASSRLASTSRSPGRPMTSGSRRAVGVHERDDDVLQRRGGGVAGVGEQLLRHRDQRLDGRGVRGVLDVRLGQPVERDRVGDDGGDRLDVGRVAAGRADEGVLADRGRVQELLALGAAHRARHRRDDHVVQARAGRRS